MRSLSPFRALLTLGLILVPTSTRASAVLWQDSCTNNGSCNSTYQTGTGYGVYVSSSGYVGVYGSGGAIGVRGDSSGTGVYGVSLNGYGAHGGSNSGHGVLGESTTGYGVYGTSSSNTGVRGYSSSGAGVYGQSFSNVGGRFQAGANNAVLGLNSDTNRSAAAISAVSGSSSTGLAYYGAGGIAITSSFAEKSGGGSWSAPSDSRLKKDVSNYLTGLATLRQVRPVRYSYNGLGGTIDSGEQYVGVIAQELEVVQPSMVSSERKKLTPNDTEEIDIRRVDPSEFTYMLINAVKEQQATIDSQNARIAALEAAVGISGGKGASLGGPGGMFGLAGVMLAGAFYVSTSRRRKREDEK